MPPKSIGPPRPRLTHFLCLPLVTSTSRPQLEASISRFASRACAPHSENPLPRNAVRPVGTLHLTIGVMSLLEEERVKEAVRFLEAVDVRGILRGILKGEGKGEKMHPESETTTPKEDGVNTALQPRNPPPPPPESNTNDNQTPSHPSSSHAPPTSPLPPLTLTLHALHPMHHPTSTSTLYAHPISTNPSFPLLPFCSSLRTIFTASGFLLPDTRPLLLHATVVNTIYAKFGAEKSRTKARPHTQARKFDATELIARFGDDWVWAEDVRVERIAICRMGAEWDREEGVQTGYVEVGSLSLM